jgi:hypothetical protein
MSVGPLLDKVSYNQLFLVPNAIVERRGIVSFVSCSCRCSHGRRWAVQAPGHGLYGHARKLEWIGHEGGLSQWETGDVSAHSMFPLLERIIMLR